MRKLAVFGICVCLGAGAWGLARADEPTPEVSPSPSAPPGKSVVTKVEPRKPVARVVGVRAVDPSQNGKVDTSTSLSTGNASSMGVGLQFRFGAPAEAVDPAAPASGPQEPGK